MIREKRKSFIESRTKQGNSTVQMNVVNLHCKCAQLALELCLSLVVFIISCSWNRGLFVDSSLHKNRYEFYFLCKRLFLWEASSHTRG